MKYQNSKNGLVGRVVEQDDVRKTIMLEMEDGTTKVYSMSTVKRWWTELPEEEDVMAEAEEKNAKKEQVTAALKKAVKENKTKAQAKKKDDDKAGDGTPLKKVGKEIAEQAKAKAKEVQKEAKPKKKKSSTPAFESEDLRTFILKYVKGMKGTTTVGRQKKDGSSMNKQVFKVGGHAFASMTFSRSNVSINIRTGLSKATPTKKSNSFFGSRFIYTEDTEANRKAMTSLLDIAYKDQSERNTNTKSKKKEAK